MDKPRLDQGPDYERGFIDGMMYQTQTTVNKAVNAMSKRTWVGLTDEEILKHQDCVPNSYSLDLIEFAQAIEAKLKEKNSGA